MGRETRPALLQNGKIAPIGALHSDALALPAHLEGFLVFTYFSYV
jgi:hypothetical protein